MGLEEEVVVDELDRQGVGVGVEDVGAEAAQAVGGVLAQGDGVVMVFAPNTLHEPLFRALEAEAAGAGVGLWGEC